VQAWINDASTNYGVIIQDYGVSSGADFDSREVANASQRPKLIVNYEAPAAAAVMAAFGVFDLPPEVDAGRDITLAYGSPALLRGTVGSHGSPLPPDSLSIAWSKTSGPGNVAFADSGQLETTASFSDAGSYVLRLSVFDDGVLGFDELTVTVLPSLI
jgi:hypothetical protein